jgi:transketolase
MRAVPNTQVIVPSDATEVDQALRACVEQPVAGPIFLRLGRGPEYLFTDPSAAFTIGKARRLREGSDLCIVANGPMVFEALLASDALHEHGVQAGVLNVHTVKPIDRETILEAAATAGAMLVVEEHNIHGGLGSAVLEVLDGGHTFPVERLGLEDRYPPIGPTFELRAALGLDAEHITQRALALLQRARGRSPSH